MIAWIDIESACPGVSPDPARDKIVHLGIRVTGAPNTRNTGPFLFKFNPGFSMRQENIDIHGITNEEAATYPFLDSVSGAAIIANLSGCDIGGFNSNNYDVPLLWEELFRVGLELPLRGVRLIDAGNLMKKKEERSLSAAVKFYCGEEHVGAHGAVADVSATIRVFNAQLLRYPDVGKMTPEELAKFCAYDDRIDLAGKIVKGPDGAAIYNFGKSKGKRVVDDPGFGYWMLGKDFSENTKRAVRSILDGPAEESLL